MSWLRAQRVKREKDALHDLAWKMLREQAPDVAQAMRGNEFIRDAVDAGIDLGIAATLTRGGRFR